MRARSRPLASLAALRQAQSLVQAQRAAEAVPLFIAAAQDTALPAQVRVTACLEGAAAAEGVPPLPLLALVRQESGFQVRAGSAAGAMGLTQVIPETGRLIASALQTE
ncbi:MAG: hypothetical protein EXR65_05730 [Dehalococcoidia bacterium]|nr:hypothetical protein [Dehalococcoidia bacterium]